MHIKFQEIQYRNILSTGNHPIKIRLDKLPSTLIYGKNGAGKSTLLDALSFVLYGKPFRKINKPQLVNTVNEKDMLVEVWFTIGDNQFHIQRGVKPNVFVINKNGKMIDQSANAKDYQDYLERFILKMNHKSFTQIVVLGSSTFTPFMQLTLGQRREVIEDLLDLQIFTRMNANLKTMLSELKSRSKDINSKYELSKHKLSAAIEYNNSVDNQKSKGKKVLAKKIVNYGQEIETRKIKIRELSDSIKPLPYNIQKIVENSKVLSDAERSTESKIYLLEDQRRKLQEVSICMECGQAVDEDHKKKSLAKLEETLKKLQTKLKAIRDSHDILTEKYESASEVNEENAITNEQIRGLKNEMAFYEKTLEDTKKELRDIEKEEVGDKKDLSILNTEVSNLEIEKRRIDRTNNTYTYIATLLAEGGIKSIVLKEYIPIMNKIIAKYLNEFGLLVSFTLDEEFQETIHSKSRSNFSYSSFSEGEKLRIDLALLFAWREISKMRQSVTTNLLIMDEILDSSLDSNGTEDFHKALRDMLRDSNVFIISHKGETIAEKFNRALIFDKVKGFTVVREEV